MLPRAAPVVDDVLSLVGGTPIVRLPRFEREGGAALWGKCEFLNPSGSVKDRVALAMLDAAAAEGKLLPGGTVVEPSSGNTGIGLALACAVRGYRLVAVMSESMSLERRALLAALGAEIVLTPAEEAVAGAIVRARAIAEERGAFMPMQFENPANPEIHRRATAAEIIEAFGSDAIDVFVAGVGTGGTVSGIGAVLGARTPRSRIVAVEPGASPVLSGGAAGPTKIQGMGAGFVPANYDRRVIDEVRTVSDLDAWNTKTRLAREEGLLVGMSSGANVFVAAAIAGELGAGKHVLTVLCDTGERYFSMAEYFR